MKTPKPNSAFPVKSIEIIWTESGVYDDNTKFYSVDAFDNALTEIAASKENIGGYVKTKYKVIFDTTDSDGGPLEYTGRIDVHHIADKQETSTGKLSMIQHMADSFGYMIGINKPNHKTQEEYENDLKVYGDVDNTDYIEWAVFLGIKDPANDDKTTINEDSGIIVALAGKVAVLKIENKELKAKLERLENLVNVIADEIANSTTE